MDEIYSLIGKAIEKFQILEHYLYLLLFVEIIGGDTKDIKSIPYENIEGLTKMEKKTLGGKLTKIKQLKIFEDERDTTVLEYLKDRRNYVVHNFFNENKLNTEKEISDKVEELSLINKDFELINAAIKKFLIDYAKNNQ